MKELLVLLVLLEDQLHARGVGLHILTGICAGLHRPDGNTIAAAGLARVGVPRMYVRAIDALYLSGDGERAAVVAEEAHRRFAGNPTPPRPRSSATALRFTGRSMRQLPGSR